MRKSMRKSALIIASIFSVSLLVFGCAGPSEKGGEAGTKTAASGKKVIQMWVMPNSMEPIKDIEEVLAPFKKANPDIDVVVTSVDWGSAWTKITTAATSGDTPDIVQLGSTWVGAISAMGALADLKDKVAEIGGGAAFIEPAWVSSGLEGSGTVTAIPWFVDSRAMYYRSDVFRQLRLTSDSLKTWGSFENSLKTIKEAELEIEGVRVYPMGIPGKND